MKKWYEIFWRIIWTIYLILTLLTLIFIVIVEKNQYDSWKPMISRVFIAGTSVYIVSAFIVAICRIKDKKRNDKK